MIRGILPAATAALALFLGACNGSSTAAPVVTGFPLTDHPHVPLLDVAGNQLTEASTEPYSPKRTCGGCHDYDAIANAYHFQQGRTDAAGNVVMADDYFNDGRAFLKSAGMYGKW